LPAAQAKYAIKPKGKALLDEKKGLDILNVVGPLILARRLYY
jgi:hypothetical protein